MHAGATGRAVGRERLQVLPVYRGTVKCCCPSAVNTSSGTTNGGVANAVDGRPMLTPSAAAY